MKGMRRLIFLLGVVMPYGVPLPLEAQADAVGPPRRGEQVAPVYLSVRAHPRQIPSLARSIALDLEDSALEQALAQIAAQTGLRLTYSTDLLPQDHRISLRVAQITATDAVLRVLQGTALDLLIAPSGHAVLVICSPGRCHAAARDRRTHTRLPPDASPWWRGHVPRAERTVGRLSGRPRAAVLLPVTLD
jgi:hypothetical protein